MISFHQIIFRPVRSKKSVSKVKTVKGLRGFHFVNFTLWMLRGSNNCEIFDTRRWKWIGNGLEMELLVPILATGYGYPLGMLYCFRNSNELQ